MKRRSYIADWIAAFLTVTIFVVCQFINHHSTPLFKITGAVFAAAGCILAWLPFLTLSRFGRPEEGKSYMHTTVVVDRGPYAMVRHPQYLGYIFFNVAFILIWFHWIVLLISATAILFFYKHTLDEERFCIEKLGERYEDYMKRVPRFDILRGLFCLIKKKR